MNNKGFSLIELLAVITIIGILAIMITPGIISLRNSVLQSSYESKVSQIENAAMDYGTEHITELVSPVSAEHVFGNKSPNENCIYRTVGFLLNNGYLSTSNSYVNSETGTNQFLDPRDNTSMNNKRVCIRFDNNNAMKREIIAYIVEE